MTHDLYESPYSGRYPSLHMRRLFGDNLKFGTWRRMWLAIGTAQRELGVNITEMQLNAMFEQVDTIDYTRAAVLERELRHDVMAHVHTFGEACPEAAGIIHLGCTSCDITDNTELYQMRNGLGILLESQASLIRLMAQAAKKYRDLPTIGFTHWQPAQPTTVGRRVAMWLYPFVEHLRELNQLHETLPFRGIKGAVGTQDAMLKIFDGEVGKVLELERHVANTFGFSNILPITGQTYPRGLDTKVLQLLARIAADVHKMCLDIRLLQHRKEMEEPSEESQIGSSAMPYKRNPMRSERADSIARHVMAQLQEALMTQALQGLERTLDDSAGRRSYIPEAFLGTDALLVIARNIFQGIVVYPAIIKRNLEFELPFMATEEIIVAMVKEGADRQEVHERLRVISRDAGNVIKINGADNPFTAMIESDPFFEPIKNRLSETLDPGRYVGLASLQVDRFLEAEVHPLLESFPDPLEARAELHV